MASIRVSHASHDVGGADAQIVVLAGGVDIHHDDVVGVAKAFRELGEQGPGAAVGMGLEDGPDFAIRVAPSRSANVAWISVG